MLFLLFFKIVFEGLVSKKEKKGKLKAWNRERSRVILFEGVMISCIRSLIVLLENYK